MRVGGGSAQEAWREEERRIGEVEEVEAIARAERSQGQEVERRARKGREKEETGCRPHQGQEVISLRRKTWLAEASSFPGCTNLTEVARTFLEAI